MNILIITPKIPYPLTEGGKISQYAVIDYLRGKHSVILVSATYTSEDEKNLDALKQLWPEVTIEKIQMWSTSPQIRKEYLIKMQNRLLTILKKIRSNVKKWVKKLFYIDKKQEIPVSEIDSPWIVQIAPVKNRKFINGLLNIVNKYKIDIIQIDFLEYVDLVLALPKEIKKVFVHHEIKFARVASTLKISPNEFTPFNNYILDFVRSRKQIF